MLYQITFNGVSPSPPSAGSNFFGTCSKMLLNPSSVGCPVPNIGNPATCLNRERSGATEYFLCPLWCARQEFHLKFGAPSSLQSSPRPCILSKWSTFSRNLVKSTQGGAGFSFEISGACRMKKRWKFAPNHACRMNNVRIKNYCKVTLFTLPVLTASR